MVATDLVDLEGSIKDLSGVLGCVILTTPDGTVAEIQAFTTAGTDQKTVQEQIEAQVASRGMAENVHQIFVFELEATSQFGDRETLERAAELAEQEARARGPGSELPSRSTVVTERRATGARRDRPPLLRVSLSSSTYQSAAEVAIGVEEEEILGTAAGERTPHGLKVLAEATLEAVYQLIGDDRIKLIGASLISLAGSEAVLVLVREEGRPELLGAALIREGPVTEAAVRATLDAVNRRLTY